MSADILCELGDSGYYGGEKNRVGGESRKMLGLGSVAKRASLVSILGREMVKGNLILVNGL